MSDILLLKQVYEEIQTAPIAFAYGPLRGYTDGERVQRLWRTVIDDVVHQVNATEHRVEDGWFVVEAASPWHAYFYLRAQHQYVFRGGQKFGLPLDQRTYGDHMFFRGQRCADWKFNSSLGRKSVEEQDRERRATLCLKEYFRSMFAANEDMADITGRCFAQHYGIATNLVDITCEPDIATWFATHPHDATCTSGQPLAVVRAFTWAGQIDHAATVCLLPPPFVRNVYEQRGLFIDTSTTGAVLEGKLKLDARFPRATEAGEFEVLREGKRVDMWPDLDEDEKDLIQWARSLADLTQDFSEIPGLVREQRRKNLFPHFWLSRELYDFEKHVTAWCSILDWVLPATCATALPAPAGSAGPLRYELVIGKARALVRANPSFFRAFCYASEGMNVDRFPILKGVLDIARTEVRK